MRKWRAATLVLVIFAASVLIGVPAQAARPRIYHTIVYTNAFAAYSQTSGCLRTDVFLSAGTGQFASQPGPVDKQARTGLGLRVVDVCAGPVAAAAGGDGTVLFDGLGVVEVGPTLEPRLAGASVSGVVPVEDDLTGRTVRVRFSATWTAVGPLEKGPVHYHLRLPEMGVSNTNENLRARPATALVTVTSSIVEVQGTTDDARIEQDRFRCMEVVHPHYEGDSDWCFGFPA